MADFIMMLSATGLMPYMVGVVIAFGAMALYFGFIRRA